MKVIDPGHVFALAFLDGSITSPAMPRHGVLLSSTLTFVKREGVGYPGNAGHHPGTNLQEVLRALISRVKYLDAQESHPNNALVIQNLRHAIWLLEQRAAERHGRSLELSAMGVVDIRDASIEEAPVCPLCGHVGCAGECREEQDLREPWERLAAARHEAAVAHKCDGKKIVMSPEGRPYCFYCGWNREQR